MRSIEMSAKTVEAAVQAACEALGVDRDDINVSYEVLEFPARKLFKTIPAKVLVKVEEPEVEEVKPVEDAPAPVEALAAPAEEAAPAVEPAAEESAEAPVEEDASADEEVPLDIAADPRLQAAVDYLTPIFKLMGVEEFSFTAVKKGEATNPARDRRAHGCSDRPPRRDDGEPVLPGQPGHQPHGRPLRKAGPGCGRLPQQARG